MKKIRRHGFNFYNQKDWILMLTETQPILLNKLKSLSKEQQKKFCNLFQPFIANILDLMIKYIYLLRTKLLMSGPREHDLPCFVWYLHWIPIYFFFIKSDNNSLLQSLQKSSVVIVFSPFLFEWLLIHFFASNILSSWSKMVNT